VGERKEVWVNKEQDEEIVLLGNVLQDHIESIENKEEVRVQKDDESKHKEEYYSALGWIPPLF
jgi:hypothetical protein